MLQELRDYWLPVMLFVGTLLVASGLLIGVAVMPFVAERFQITHDLVNLFAEDVVVRRCSLAAAIGLIVTAFVFFRPKPASPKPDHESQP